MRLEPGAALAAVALALLLAAAARGEAVDAAAPAPEQVLKRAFDNRYEVDTRELLEVEVRGPHAAPSRRRLALATKRIGGRLHSLGRFLEPSWLRGMTILSIENPHGSDDHFVWLRELAKLRRISSAQRGDAFMGTDLSYEDFERQRVADYVLEARPAARIGGEPVHVISAAPRAASAYVRVEFCVAQADAAILETRYFKRGAEAPFKVIHAPRAHTREIGGHALPTRVLVENHARGTQTEVWLEQIAVDPGLDDGLFTAAAVEVGRPIPGLER
jgi:hypothetical protein